jgi:hypothetical protein
MPERRARTEEFNIQDSMMFSSSMMQSDEA